MFRLLHGTNPTKARTEAFVATALFLAGVAIVLCVPRTAGAVPTGTQEGPSVPCAILESFGGQVQLLDSSRTHLLGTSPKAPIPCGGWVSVGGGWAIVKHREGFRIHLSPQSFAEVANYAHDGKGGGDHMLLYKGQAFGHASGGQGELRIVTANARARLKRSSGIVIYSQEDEDTQFIVLSEMATLENRFESARSIDLKGGEASSLNLRQLRVVPSTPKAVTVTSLKPKLAELVLDNAEGDSYLLVARDRQARKFPEIPAEKITEKKEKSREPASPNEYARHREHDAVDAQLHERLIRRTVGGVTEGEKILFPDKFYGKPQTVKVQVLDAAAKAEAKLQRKRQQEDDAEKKRLMEELAQIRAD